MFIKEGNMAAILRVKRRRDEDPVESLLIKCKKPREDVSKIDDNFCFTLVTTINSKDDAISKRVQKALRQKQLRANFKSHDSTRAQRSRVERKENIKANRYKIVNCKRAVDESVANGLGNSLSDSEAVLQNSEENASGDSRLSERANVDEGGSSSGSNQAKSNGRTCEASTSSVQAGGDAASGSGDESRDRASDEDYNIDILDIEQESAESVPDTSPQQPSASGITLNGQSLVSQQVAPPAAEGEGNFVYDLYYISHNPNQYSFRDLENILSIEAQYDELVFENDRQEAFEEVYDDEDDSNDESNWRNDYPDDDPDLPEPPDSDREDYNGDHHVEEQRSYFHFRDDDDDFLSQAMGTRLQLFGSSGEEDDDDDDADEVSGRPRTFQGRGSYYNWYMNRARRDLNRAEDDDDRLEVDSD